MNITADSEVFIVLIAINSYLGRQLFVVNSFRVSLMKFNTNKSMVNYQHNDGAKARVFCFSNAGGGPSMFRQWHTFLENDVEVWAAAYPGRDTLSGEPFAKKISSLVSYYISDLSLFSGGKVIFYGHSFGALVAYKLAIKLRDIGCSVDVLCVGARRSPTMLSREKMDVSSDKKLVDQLTMFGGIPDILLDDKDMLNYFLPHIRNDLVLNEEVISLPNMKLDIPIFAFSSPADSLVLPKEIRAWGDCTHSSFENISLSGGHFFIKNNERVFFNQMNKIIEKSIA